MAHDIALVFDGWQKIGMLPMPGAIKRLTTMLGRPLRSLRGGDGSTAALLTRQARDGSSSEFAWPL